MNEETVKVRCWLIEEREKAILISMLPPDKNVEHFNIWLPRSQLEHISKEPALSNGWRECIITMPLWLAENKKLI